MSFGGTVMGMIVSLKNNSKLLSKRKTYKDLSGDYKYRLGEPLKYKELPERELLNLKAKIRADFARQRRLFVLKSIFLVVVTLGVGGVILGFINTNYLYKSKRSEKNLKSLLESTQYRAGDFNERGIDFYLNNGYDFLSKSNYVSAKYYFKKAYVYGPADFKVLYANAKVYVYDCIYNHVECEETMVLLEYLKQHFGTNQEVIDLIAFYHEEH